MVMLPMETITKKIYLELIKLANHVSPLYIESVLLVEGSNTTCLVLANFVTKITKLFFIQIVTSLKVKIVSKLNLLAIKQITSI